MERMMMKKQRIAVRLACILLAICVLFTGCSASPTVMKVDGTSVSQGIYAYFYGYLSAMYSLYGYSLDAETLDSYALEQVKQYYAIKALAKELNITLTADENKTFLDDKSTEIETMGGQSVYNQFIKDIGVTDSQYNDLGKSYTIYQKVASYYYGDTGTEKPTDETLKAEYEKTYIHATHILISTEEAETEDDRAKLLKEAEEVLAKVKAGEDFIALIKEYGDDPGVAETPEVGYYFTTGEMDAAFETAAFELEVGATSEIVTGTYGYHIIKRLPMDEAYVQSVLDDGSFYSTYCTELLSAKITTLTAAMTLEKLPAYDTMDMTSSSNAWYNYLYSSSSTTTE